jgi:uncharacterized membrane protein
MTMREPIHRLRAFLASINRFPERLGFFFSQGRNAEIFVVGAVVAYTVFFSVMTILRYLSLNASAYDLGIYNQSMYTAARSGRFFYYTADLPANPKGSIFGAHFSPVFFLLLPVYFLFPRVETMLAIQSFALALGAVPVFLIARRLISVKVALVLAVLYLLSPLIQGVNWFDFHPEAFIPVSFLTAIYAMESRKPLLYFACILVAVSSLEFMPALTALYSLIILLDNRISLVALLRHRKFTEQGPMALISLLISIGWAILAVFAVGFFNPTQTFLFGGANFWTVLGASSLVTVPIQAVLNPVRALSALNYELPLKVGFLVLLLAPFALFLTKAIRFVILIIPWTFVLLMSNQTSYYQFNDQYVALFVPFLFAGMVYGWSKLRWKNPSNRRIIRGLKLCSIALGIIVLLLVTPFSGVPFVGSNVFGYRGFPTVGSHEQLVAKVISLMPPDASVLTQANIFPLVSSRLNAFLFPYQSFYPPGTGFNSTLSLFMNESEYILVDTKTDAVTPTWLINLLNSSPTHGIYAAADGILLFKKSYSGPLALFVPISETWAAKDLVPLRSTLVTDTLTTQGSSLFHSTNNLNDTGFWSGPYTVLAPGRYLLDLSLRIASPASGYLVQPEVDAYFLQVRTQLQSGVGGGYYAFFYPYLSPQTVLASMNVFGGNFTGLGYQDFKLEFTTTHNGYFNFAGTHASSVTGIYLESVRILQESGYA